jgi:hypothetical protein
LLQKDDDLALKLRTILFAAVRLKLKVFCINSYRQAYFSILQGCVADGLVTQIEKKFLRDFREANNISLEDHRKSLEELDWTLEDFQKGYKPPPMSVDAATSSSAAVPAIKSTLYDAYDRLLLGCIQNGAINEIEKSVLAMYRYDNHIEAEHHEEALRKFGWTKEEFVRGMKAPTINFGNIIIDIHNK